MSNTTNTERCEIAEYCRSLGNKEFSFSWDNIAHVIGVKNYEDDVACWFRLADLIEPNDIPNLTDMYTWAYNRIEGADEPEFSLYIGICDVISKYFNETGMKRE